MSKIVDELKKEYKETKKSSLLVYFTFFSNFMFNKANNTRTF